MSPTQPPDLPGLAPARRIWVLLEPLHAVTYFAAPARAAFEAAGLRGFWRGYFAGRAAPLGPVDAPPVTALFNVFAPSMVARALPDVWSRATPEAALAARVEGATTALRDLIGPQLPTAARDTLPDLADAVRALDGTGRPLGDANGQLLDSYDEPFARLWQLATTVREHRGDGHVAALAAAGVDGVEALVWRAALDGSPDVLQGNRGWTDGEWAAATSRLRDRGWLDASDAITEAGRSAHGAVEDATDRNAGAVWDDLGGERIAWLVDAVAPLTLAVVQSLPQPNPIGLPSPQQIADWLATPKTDR